MALAGCLLADLWTRGQDLQAHYTDAGVLPRAVLLTQFAQPWHLSLHLISGQWAVQAALLLLAAVCAVALLCGYRTRLATWGSWLLLCSLHSRNAMVLQGGDELLRLLLFWSLFLPLGACWSLDARRTPQQFPAPVCSMGILGLLVQLACVYGAAALFKTGVEWHSAGSAVAYTLHIDQMGTPLGTWVRQFPALMRGLTHSVFWLEALVPLWLLLPQAWARVSLVVAVCLLHLGIGACMNVGLFPYIASTAMLWLIPGAVWDRLGARWHTTANTAPGLPTWPAGIFAGLALLYVVHWNVMQLRPLPELPGWRIPGWVLRLDQYWGMFAPAPLKEDGWYVFPGTLRNGETIDVFPALVGRQAHPVRWEKPASVAAMYRNQRWRKYLMNVWMPAHSKHRLYLGRYLCREWNGRHPESEQLLTFKMYFMLEYTLPDFQVAPPQKTLLWTHQCFS